jgi:glucose-6-phosphate 1-dehydrogenase
LHELLYVDPIPHKGYRPSPANSYTNHSLLVTGLQVEKPFGKDLGSSRELQKALEPNWREEEIFRIDHYLGKEMVKNLLILRFGNEFFNATWSHRHIDNVQVLTSINMDLGN